MKNTSYLLRPLVLVAILLWVPLGCETDDDPDHVPPAGSGAMFLENHTYEDIRVYIGGIDKGEVSDYSDRPFDLRPGTYRVVLDQEDTTRSWRGDVDIIENRLTVLDVTDDYNDLDVVIYFD